MFETVSEIGGTPTTRASTGYEQRARDLQELVGDAHRYLADGLGTDFSPIVMVLDQTDWMMGGDDAPPYGIPYAADEGFDLVVPADPTRNFLVDIYAASGSRKSAERFADLIAVHELGHLHTRAMGLTLPQGWLSEFLATYLACCFLVAHRPEDASLWFTLARARTDGAGPEHRSLEALDELYFGVGAENYIWYQDALSVKVGHVQADMGLDFARQMRSAVLTPDSDTRTTLAAAENIHPGFEAWAAALGG
ncbi:MAG TPA: hypothetical protein VGK78_19830 [Nocardioides sp.]|uniref:hypothetical protein n=1 Tax=Nocardioides sp. TaxID=35761 RepID=UPI002F42F24E